MGKLSIYTHAIKSLADMKCPDFTEFDNGDIPEDKYVFTTWHENEPLKEVFRSSKNDAFHPIVDIQNTVIIHISSNNKEKTFLAEYANV